MQTASNDISTVNSNDTKILTEFPVTQMDVIYHELYHKTSLMWCSILKGSLSMYGSLEFYKDNYLCIVCTVTTC